MTAPTRQPASSPPEAPGGEGLNIGLLYGLATHACVPGGAIRGHYLVRGLSERGHRLHSWRDRQGENPLVTHYPRWRDLRAFLRAIDVLYIRVSPDSRRARWTLLQYLRRRPLPVVWQLDGLPEDRLFTQNDSRLAQAQTAQLKRYARFAAAGVGVTERMNLFLHRALEIPLTATVTNGTDPALFRPNQTPGPGPLRVAWVGSGHPQYSEITPLLDAAHRLAQRGSPVRFYVFAPRESLPETLPSNLQCEGVVPYEKLGRYLGRMDVGVLLLRRRSGIGLRDGSPPALFDYLAAGLAVVAQDDGQIGQLLRRHQAGVFTVGTSDDLDRVLLRLHADRQLRGEMGARGREAVEKHYCWSHVVDQTETLIRQAVNAMPPPTG